MSLQIITANPKEVRTVPEGVPFLDVAEFFCDTIQGENLVGWPAAFLRVKNCSMSCHWCDTTDVWRFGNPYTFKELFELMDAADLPRKLFNGQHLVLTGGSPLKQQEQLANFLNEFIDLYGFKPYIEIENECTIMPSPEMIKLVDCWNNSPKLSNSGNEDIIRYQPRILEKLATLKNSWFKFVIMGEYDWVEIKRDFIDKSYIGKEQVVLMPEGATRAGLEKNREKVVEIAIRENVRYTTREHVILWDKATGV